MTPSAEEATEPAGETRSAEEAPTLSGLLSDSAIYGLGSAAERGVGFVLLPITTRVLGPADYGVLNLWGATAAAVYICLSLGLLEGFLREYNVAKSRAARRRVASTAATLAAMIGLIGSAILLPLLGPLNDLLFSRGAPLYLAFMLPMTLGSIVRLFGAYRLQADRRPWTFISLSMAHTVATRTLALALAVPYGVWGWFLGEMIGFLATGVATLAVVFRDARPAIDPVPAKRMLFVGLGIALALVANWLVSGTDKYMIRAFLDDWPTQLGYFSVGERIANVMHLANIAFLLGWRPFALGNLARGDNAKLARGVTIYLLLAFQATLLLALLGDDLSYWILAPEYAPGFPLVSVLTLAMLLNGTSDVFNLSLLFRSRPDAISATTSAAAAINVALNALLLPAMGIYGAALATLFCQAAKLGLTLLLVNRLEPMPVEGRRVAVLALLLATAFLLGRSLDAAAWALDAVPRWGEPVARLLVGLAQTALCLAVPALLWRGGFLLAEEREAIRRAWTFATRLLVSRGTGSPREVS